MVAQSEETDFISFLILFLICSTVIGINTIEIVFLLGILYPLFNKETNCFKKIESGIFGADMKVNVENDGPFTIIMESEKRK